MPAPAAAQPNSNDEGGLDRLPPASLRARYEKLERIGEGSMGTVFRGYDSRLGRAVAIKLLKSDAPSDTRRFLSEARAQARVRHENVCQVYEAGEADGEPYIVMELIDGVSLDHASSDMPLEQKVKVIREVAAALHEAHRLGMIHRDIKPGNIMVVRNEDGSFKPYVVDFGLARDVSSTGASTQNGIVGTPAYMSPEQAAGNSALLDRRTDVYSLGATLYELIAGRTPFVGSNALILLTQVIYDDPPALGNVRKGVPRQLEIIVMTSLQRDLERRYQSALALGEDLQRFLDGRLIQAKPPPLGYVLRQKAKRHKALVAVASIGACIAIVLGGMWLRSAQQAAKQAEIARELGEDVKYVELFLRSVYGLPTHDITKELQIVRARLVKIERRMVDAGPAGRGPGHYALGRAYVALHEYEYAREHLESALRSGYAKPEVHYALGLALGGRYQQALDDARRIEDAAAREMATKKAVDLFRQPALEHLRASGETEVESRAYIEGLIALYEQHYDVAAAKADAAIMESPWLYEARKLNGDAHFEEAVIANARGQREKARQLFSQSVDAYQIGSTIARSDAGMFEMLCEAWKQQVLLDRWEGRPFRTAFDATIAACDAALVIDHRHVRALQKKSQVHLIIGHQQLANGDDPRNMLKSAIDFALAARDIQPEDAIIADELGNAFTNLAQYDRKIGRDPGPMFDRAMMYFDEATRMQPGFAWAWNDGGVAMMVRTGYEIDNGLDPRPSADAAMERFDRTAKEDPAYIGSYSNATFILGIRAAYELSIGVDPHPTVARAIKNAEQGSKVDPKWLPLLNNRGWAELVAAQYEENTGADPTKTLDNVRTSFQASLDINKDEADTQFGMGSAKHVRALYEIRNHRDPQKYLDQARAFLTHAAELDSNEPAIRLELGQFFMTSARYAIEMKNDPMPSLLEAERVLREGLRVNARHAPLHAALAEGLAMLAEYGPQKEDVREKRIADGLAAAKEALVHNPQWALAFAARGTLYALRAAMKQDHERDENLRLAREALDKAFAINAQLPQRFKTKHEALRGITRGVATQTAQR